MESGSEPSAQPSHSLHDRFFREAFANLAAAADFLQTHLPSALVGAMDWSSLETMPASFIDQHLQTQSADLLYRIQCRGQPCLIYVLFEHQSTVAPQMPLRLLGYMVRIWEEEIRRPERTSGQLLPLIIPILLHQGPGVWQVSHQFLDHLVWPDGLREELEPFVPKFEHLMVDLGAVSLEEVRGKLAARVLLGLMKAAREGLATEWFQKELPHLLEMMRQETLAGLVNTAARYWFYANEVPASTWRREVLKLAAGETAQSFMSLAEQLILEGKLEGKLEGRREGLEEGRREGKLEGERRGRAEGLLQGRILALQEVLGLPITSSDELSALSLDQLQELLARLQTQLRSRS